MAVKIHFMSTGIVPGQARPVSLIGRSLTIGRGEDNDLVLPDPDKLISRRHCAIEDHDGNIIVVDFSTSGTFLNYCKVALGKVQTPLNNGDILSVGGYELLVEITAAKGPALSSNTLPPPDDLIAPSPSLSPLAPVPGRMPGDRMSETSSDVDFLDDLLGLSTPPAEPGKVQRQIPDDDGPLPPVGPDDLLTPMPDPMRGHGANLPSHSQAIEDHIRPGAPMAAPGNVSTNAIPDDWDDFLSPLPGGAAAADPFAQPTGMRIGRKAFEDSRQEKTSPRWRRGNALFRIPRMMWTETAELAELRLTPHDALTVEMRALLERSMVGRGTQTDEHAVARLGTRMKAALHADPRDLEVTPLGTDVQVLEDDAVLGWDWRVVPLREGPTLVTLRLTMLADLDGRETALDAQALHTSVEITVRTFLTRPHRFVRDNWRWMLGSSGIGAIAALWALLGA